MYHFKNNFINKYDKFNFKISSLFLIEKLLSNSTILNCHKLICNGFNPTIANQKFNNKIRTLLSNLSEY